jgi:acetyl/propionyl-CoA carboxylase alpha subunit
VLVNDNAQIAGLTTNIDFLVDLSEHPEFIAGNVSTKFIAVQRNTKTKAKTGRKKWKIA